MAKQTAPTPTAPAAPEAAEEKNLIGRPELERRVREKLPNLLTTNALAHETTVAVLDAIKEIIIENIDTDGARLKLPGYFSFKIVHKAARTRTNPATGKKVMGHAKRKIKLVLGADLMLLETVKAQA